MKKLSILMLLITLSLLSLNAQDCFKYFPTKKGTSLEYTDYDKKGKETGTSIRTVVDRHTENGADIIDYRVEVTPEDSDTTLTNEYSVSCKDGKVYIDVTSMLNQEQYGEGMEIEVEGGQMEFPSNPKAGQELEGGTMTIIMKSDGNPVMTITSEITNRKVAATETITTPAGTFETVKITYDLETQMSFMDVKGSVAEWYSEKYGLIKTENYNKKGKVESSSVLTKIISE